MFLLKFHFAVFTSAILLILFIAVESVRNEPELAQFGLAIKMAKTKFVKEPESKVWSPALVGTALAMLYTGAKAETESAIGSFIGGEVTSDQSQVQRSDIHNYFRTVFSLLQEPTYKERVKIANKIYVGKGLELNDTFERKMKENYDSEIRVIDFNKKKEAEEEINGFVKEKTENMIEKIVELQGKPTQRLMLINALYFNADWDMKFDPKKSYDNSFYLEGGHTKQVKMMTQTESFWYSDEGNYKAIELPFVRGKLWFVAVLPKKYSLTNAEKKDGLEEILNQVSPFPLLEGVIKQKMRSTKVLVTLPKFKIETTISNMKDVLAENLDLQHTFSGANFAGMAQESLQVSQMIHKAVIEVDEKGARGGAGNATGMTRGGPSGPTFIANHPFVFFILAGTPRTVLFSGIYNGD